METTKEQLLMDRLRKVGRKMRGGMPFRPGMPPMPPHCDASRVPGMPLHRMDAPHMPGMPPAGMGRGFGMGRFASFPREMILMIVLDAGETGVRQKDIADALGINPSSLSEQIDRLETDRYLERKANPDDKRSTLITLTEKGKARAYEVRDERQRRAAEFFSALTDEEKDALLALLDKLLGESS